MHTLTNTLVILTLSLAIGTAAGSADLFPRGVYWPQERVSWLAERAGIEFWTYVDQVMAELKVQHCNFIWVVNSDVPSLQKLCAAGAAHDIQVAGNPGGPFYNWRQHRTPDFAVRTAQSAVDELGETEGLYAYVHLDEPALEELAYLDTIRRELGRLDPTRESLVVTMRPQTLAAIDRTGFRIITCDVYPFFFDGDPNGPNPAPNSRAYYRTVTSALATQCQKVGKTFWIMPQVYSEIWGDWYHDENMHVVAQPGAYLHWRTPTVGESRWMIWQGLASGAQGIVFFVLFPAGNERMADSEPGPPGTHPFPKITQTVHTHQPNALLNIDSSPTEQMIAIGEEFAQIERLEPILRELRLSRFPAVFTTAPFHGQTFVDDEGSLYAIVVNDNTDEPVTREITLLPGITQLDDLRADAPLALTEAEKYSLQRATLSLEGGGGTLLRLAADPAHRPMPTMTEDFSAPIVTGWLEDARVRMSTRGWGVGWNYELVQADGGNPPVPATLTCSISGLTGDPKVHRPSGPIYVVYDGRANQGFESVVLSFATDGENFTWGSVDEFNAPVPIPPGASHLRFTLKNGGSLAAFYTIATELPGK